jgi:hypothetical protein
MRNTTHADFLLVLTCIGKVATNFDKPDALKHLVQQADSLVSDLNTLLALREHDLCGSSQHRRQSCCQRSETNLDEDELRGGEKCSEDRNGKRTWIGRPKIRTPRPTSAE